MRASLLLVALSLLLPVAAADESHADCEETQPWIGYARTDPARLAVEPALADAGIALDACEGEHWDGQEAVVGGDSTSIGMGADPNGAPSSDPTSPAAARVTTADGEAYAAYNMGFVARGAFYVGTCGSGEAGLEGDAACGGTRELRTGVYVRDNTPGNIVATFARCLFTIAGCDVAESDCSQAAYQHGQYDPPAWCGRDNTALGARLILP